MELTLKNLEMFPKFSTEVFNGNFMIAVTKITEAYLPLLLIRTPHEVLLRAPLVYRISDLLMNNPMLPVLITKLKSSEIQLVEQIEILKMLACLYYSIKFRPLAASTIAGFNVNQFGIIYHVDAINSLKELALTSSCFPVKDMSLLCLSFVLKYSNQSEVKSQLVTEEFLSPICNLVTSIEQTSTIMRLSFLLRLLAKEIRNSSPDKRDIRMTLHAILWTSATTWQLSEECDVAKNVLHTAKYCFKFIGVTEEFFPLLQRIIGIVTENYFPVFLRKLALMTMVFIVDESPDVALHCTDMRLLNTLSDVLYDLSVESSVRRAILSFVNSLALKGHSQAIVQSKLGNALVKLLSETSILRSDVLVIFKSVVNGSSIPMIKSLLDLNLHKMLLGTIFSHKYVDEELKSIGIPVSVYYDGFAIVSSIQILNSIVQKGFGNGITNSFTEKFSLETISQLKDVQQAIFSFDLDLLRSLTRPIIHIHCGVLFDALLLEFYETLVKTHSSSPSPVSKSCLSLLSNLTHGLKRYMTKLNSNSGNLNPDDFSSFVVVLLFLLNSIKIHSSSQWFLIAHSCTHIVD